MIHYLIELGHLNQSDDKLVESYRESTSQAMEKEAIMRLEQSLDPIIEEKLRKQSLIELYKKQDKETLEKALLSRLGIVRAALIEHEGGMIVSSAEINKKKESLNLILNLKGGCIACGAAPGTLVSITNNLEKDPEIGKIFFNDEIRLAQKPLIQSFLDSETQISFVTYPIQEEKIEL